jgi:hypothetical protein
LMLIGVTSKVKLVIINSKTYFSSLGATITLSQLVDSSFVHMLVDF